MAALFVLSIPQTIAIHRQKYPEGLVCTSCGRLLATRRDSHVLTDEERLAYVCVECRQGAQETAQQSTMMRASFARSKELASARRLRPPLVVVAESQTHDSESHAFIEQCAEGEVGGRLPCEHCLGSHLARECGYAAHEAQVVRRARKLRTRPSTRIWPETQFEPTPTHAISSTSNPINLTAEWPLKTIQRTMRWGRRGKPGRPRVTALLKERARSYARAYRDRLKRREQPVAVGHL